MDTGPHPTNSYPVIFNHRNLTASQWWRLQDQEHRHQYSENSLPCFASLASGNRWHSLACVCFALLCIHLHMAPSVAWANTHFGGFCCVWVCWWALGRAWSHT